MSPFTAEWMAWGLLWYRHSENANWLAEQAFIGIVPIWHVLLAGSIRRGYGVRHRSEAPTPIAVLRQPQFRRVPWLPLYDTERVSLSTHPTTVPRRVPGLIDVDRRHPAMVHPPISTVPKVATNWGYSLPG